jgi:Tfp pilus assembly protein PilN
MNRANLIPLQRQLRHARRARLRAWSVLLGAIAGSLLLACGVLFLDPSQTSAPAPDAFTKVAGELAQTNQETATVRRQLAALREQVNSRRFVLEQPDYSLLLSMISQVVDDSVVLDQCELSSGGTQSNPSQGQVLKVGGFARSQSAVAGFMLQLETTGIFKKVTLVRSQEQPVLDRQAAAFQVQCLLGPPNKGAP